MAENKEKAAVENRALSIGASAVEIFSQATRERRQALRNPETLEATRDFVFGLSQENPLAYITDVQNDKLEALRS